MTTHIYTATRIIRTDTDGDGQADEITMGQAQVEFVVPDDLGGFSYDIRSKTPGDFPQVRLVGLDAYDLRIDGAHVGPKWQTSFGRIDWHGDQKSFVLEFQRGDTSVWIQWGGDDLPPIGNQQEYEDFMAGAVLGTVRRGGLSENGELGFDAPVARDVTQDDVFAGGDRADRLQGGKGRDEISGGRGADRIFGGQGHDTLAGNAGADRLDGGGGRDGLTGGKGADTFVFNLGYGHDTIVDFEDDLDGLQLDTDLWAAEGRLSKKQVVQMFATKVGDDVIFDFGDAELTLLGVAGRGALRDDIIFG